MVGYAVTVSSTQSEQAADRCVGPEKYSSVRYIRLCALLAHELASRGEAKPLSR